MISRLKIQQDLINLAIQVKQENLTHEEVSTRLMELASTCGLPDYVGNQGTNPLKRVNRYSKL